MQISSKQTPQEKLTAMRKKAKAALGQKENEKQPQRTKTAQLRALRLEREAAASDKPKE